MRAARIENGLVVDLWEVESLTDFEDMLLIEAPAIVGIDWSHDGISFIAPITPQSELDLQAQQIINKEALEYLASTAWYVERLNDPSSGKAIPQDILDARATARAAIV